MNKSKNAHIYVSSPKLEEVRWGLFSQSIHFYIDLISSMTTFRSLLKLDNFLSV
jgi:hypothetical protein